MRYLIIGSICRRYSRYYINSNVWYRHSGRIGTFLSALIRRMGTNISDKLLPFVLVFLGIMSNIATDAGYLILIPLAGLFICRYRKKNPLIGMAAAFAGESAGFSANLIPATVVDVIIGTNAEAFASSQNIPFVSYLGKAINPMTMHYYFYACVNGNACNNRRICYNKVCKT